MNQTRRSRTAATVGAAATAAYWLPALALPFPRLRVPLGIRDSTSTGVALTFDDGPHPQGTRAILDVLARGDLRATFFLVGEQVERDQGLAAEVAAHGHQIGLHCHRHRSLLRLTPAQLRNDLERADDSIARATGGESSLYRPPYGLFTTAALVAAHRRAWMPLLWTKWGKDWETGATPTGILELLTRNIGQGDVLLLHDSDSYGAPGAWRRTAAALPLVLEELDRRGIPVLPLTLDGSSRTIEPAAVH